MGYPYDKTYLQQIKEDKQQCADIKKAYYVLLHKYLKEHHVDDIDLNLREFFAILAEAFELESETVSNITDVYHFMWDILDELLGVDE